MIKDETSDGCQRRADAAFTLTEVIVAVVLMLLALGLLLSAFISSKRSVALAQTHLTALQIARNEAERLQTNIYDTISNGPAYTTLTNAFIEYRMSNYVATNILNSYKDIKITVEWTAPASSMRQVLTNYMTICNTN